MKRLFSLILARCLLLSLAACANGSGSGEGAQSAQNSKITLKVASRYGSDVPDENYYRQKVEEFNKTNKDGITVQMDNIPTESDYLNKLRTSFADGDTPNVFIEYGGSRTLDYVKSDALVNLKPYLDKDQTWYKSFKSQYWSELQYKGYDGTWGVPFKSYMVVVYYNKDIFKKQGLTVPKSFDDLLKICQKLKGAGIAPFQVGEKDVFRLGHFHNCLVIKSLGTDAASKLADRSLAYDSPEMKKTYQVISDMCKKGYFGNDILNTDYNTEKSAYASGKCAMHWDGSWYVSEIYGKDIYDKTGVFQFPYLNEQYQDQEQGGSSDMWFVSKLNKSQEEIDASVKFLKYITSEEYTAGNNEIASVLYPINFTPTAKTPKNPLLDEIKSIQNKTKKFHTDLQNDDPDSHMLDTVRNALQGLAMGNSPDQCGKEIVNSIKQNAQ